MPGSKADDSRFVLGVGGIVDLIKTDDAVHGVRNSVAPLLDGNVIGFVPFALVGELLLQEVKPGVVPHSEARLVGLAISQKRDNVAVECVILAVLAIGAFVSRLLQRPARRVREKKEEIDVVLVTVGCKNAGVELDAETSAKGPVQPDGRCAVIFTVVVQIGVGAETTVFDSNSFATLMPPAGRRARTVGIGVEAFLKDNSLNLGRRELTAGNR